MKDLRILSSLVLSLIFVACSSAPPSSQGPQNSETPKAAPLHADVSSIHGKAVRLEFRRLDAGQGITELGLINRSSPDCDDLFHHPDKYPHVKPVADEKMAQALAALRHVGFFDYAKEGLDVWKVPKKGAIGAVSVMENGRKWTLVLRRGEGHTSVPKVYVDSKRVVVYLHATTFWLTPSVGRGSGDRILHLPSPGRDH